MVIYRHKGKYSISEILSILLKRAGCKHVRFHDLRHTFATMALENGMDVKTLSATIGHVSAATTVNIKNPYEQLNESKQLDYVCKMRQFGEISLLSHFPFAIYLQKWIPLIYYLLRC